MGKTKILREYLQNLLTSMTGLNSNYEQAKGAKFPYIVYSLESIKNEHRNDCILEINLWDKGSSLVIEDKADLLEEKLNKHKYIDDNMQISIYMQTRNNVSDPNDDIRRRRLTFSLYHYERG